MVNMEKQKLTEAGMEGNRYKLVTDEYFKLFEAFKESGFTEEQAFELMKAYCTSDSMARMLETYIRGTKYKDPSYIRNYMGKRYPKNDSEEKTNEAASSSL